jgi:preprotein translocase subunit SecD
MNFYVRRFNLYLLLMLAFSVAFAGCATSSKKKKAEPLAAIRVAIESSANAEGQGQTVSVLRADPVLVTVAKDPVLTEADLLRASLIATPGGFAIELKFDETGSWTLEQFSAAYAGKHFVIYAQWGDKLKDGRWLAAPLITGRIASGVLAFTPDMSREEAQKLVAGLNNVAKKLQTGK